MRTKRVISVACGCFNEEGNLRELYDRVVKALSHFPQYDYEMVVADNCSTDGSREILRDLASRDKNLKVIFNSNNFGPIRSGYNAFLRATGDAVVFMNSDLQDPPEMIVDLVRKWEQGNKVVLAVRESTEETGLMPVLRRLFYRVIASASEADTLIANFTGTGIYDRQFMDAVKRYRDPIPYFRGFVSEIGFHRDVIHFKQAKRKYGVSKHSFFSLYDVAMTGFVNHSKFPLRLATFCGFSLAGMNLLIALGYLIYKLAFWNTFSLGIAPLVIGLFFFAAVQLIFLGIVGEYVGAILTQVKNHPLVIEDEIINF